jgi:hypothetical protein
MPVSEPEALQRHRHRAGYPDGVGIAHGVVLTGKEERIVLVAVRASGLADLSSDRVAVEFHVSNRQFASIPECNRDGIGAPCAAEYRNRTRAASMRQRSQEQCPYRELNSF